MIILISVPCAGQQPNPVDPALSEDKDNEISRAWVWLSLAMCPLKVVPCTALSRCSSSDKVTAAERAGITGRGDWVHRPGCSGREWASTRLFQRKWHEMLAIYVPTKNFLPLYDIWSGLMHLDKSFNPNDSVFYGIHALQRVFQRSILDEGKIR